MRTATVLDTNVPIVANGMTDQASPDCVITCIDRLRKIRDNEKIVFDDEGRILEEYRRHLSPSGEPGAGDAFFKWLWDNQGNPGLCQKVTITPHEDRVFEEFPDSEGLRGFDRNDRKFVAAAIASGKKPPIVNATDTDWWTFRDTLKDFGIHIEFLCIELMEEC